MTAPILAVGLWCSSSDRAWSWTPRPYLGAIAIVAALVGLALWWAAWGRKHDALLTAADATSEADAGGATAGGRTATRTVAFVFGALFLWACLDWPLAALGAGYLATAQLIRQIVMVMVVAPLLLFACPPGLAVRAVGWKRRLTVLRWSARPVVAVPVASVTLVVVNLPSVVDPLVQTQYGAFFMDLAWVVAGFVLWMPVQCPHPGVRRLRGGAALTYLIAQSIVPVLPGFFMTWATTPLYSTYELAPRVFQGFGPVEDQQAAAAVLQVGGMVLLWVQISYRFLRWAHEEFEHGRRRPEPIARTASPSP